MLKINIFFYSELTKKAREINSELSQGQPNFERIIQLANEIKNASTTVPSVVSGIDIKINVGWLLGGNLVDDLFCGVFGLIHAPIMALISIFCIPAYTLSYSAYCGSPQFFLDTASYFCTSVCKIISSVLFPLSMLYSEYTTDSFNSLTKGGAERALDDIISLAKAQIDPPKETQETSMVRLPS